MDVLSLGYGGEEPTKFKVLRHGWLFVFVICVNGWINFTWCNTVIWFLIMNWWIVEIKLKNVLCSSYYIEENVRQKSKIWM